MNINLIKPFAGLFLLFLLNSCSYDRWDADVSSIDYSLKIKRLDRSVFENESWRIIGFDSLRVEYGEFLDLYLVDIMQVGPSENPMSGGLLSQFSSDPTWNQLQQIINSSFTNLRPQEARLENAIKRYAVFFEDDRLPTVIAYNSGYNVGVYPSDNYLGIGLEWYAGTSNKVVQMLPPDLFPQYKRDNMRPEFLDVNALKGWLYYKFRDKAVGETLLGNMVFAGKIHFLAQVLMEEESQELLLNYSVEQLEWCESQEYDVWKFFLEQDLLFTTDPKSINKIMNDGPFTPGMPPESPGGIGNWVGYQMVAAYMDEKEGLSLVDLMNIQDEKEFLKFYKPGL